MGSRNDQIRSDLNVGPDGFCVFHVLFQRWTIACISLTTAYYCVNVPDPIYFWQQTEGDLTVHLRLPEGVTKDDVCFRLAADQLSVGVQGSGPLLEGTLYAKVDPEASTWTIENNKR